MYFIPDKCPERGCDLSLDGVVHRLEGVTEVRMTDSLNPLSEYDWLGHTVIDWDSSDPIHHSGDPKRVLVQCRLGHRWYAKMKGGDV